MPRHPIPPARWPTRDEAAGSRLFSPAAIGGLQARTRTWVPAMVPWRATEDGFVTRDVIDWYGRFAEGRPGVIVVEATGIRDIPSGPLLRVGHDRFLPGLRDLVQEVRDRSEGQTLLFLQAIDFLRIRRRPEKDKYVRRFLRVEERHRERIADLPGGDMAARADEAELREFLLTIPHEQLLGILDEREREDLEMGARERVTDTEHTHIAELPEVLPDLFAAASRRCREAGFDGVELHYAHAYTMSSFLSRRNDRADGYGGSPEARVRLPLEVYRRVRDEVGDDYVVGCRFLGDEVIDGGSRIEDAVFYGEQFARAGMDFLSISKGGKFEDAKQPKVGEAAYPYTGVSGHECMPTVNVEGASPFGRNLPLARAIRARVRETGLETPIVGSGGVNSFELAEAALAQGDVDFVGAARQSLADPDWFLKIEQGRGEEVRRCVFTNYCEALDQKHKEVTCQLWDRDHEVPDRGASSESPVRLAQDGRRRLIAPPWTAG